MRRLMFARRRSAMGGPLAAMVLLVGACAIGTSGGDHPPGQSASKSSAATPLSAGTATASTPWPSSVALTHRCLVGEVSFVSSAARPGRYTACVRAGTTVAVLLAAPPAGRWAPIHSTPHDRVAVIAERSGSSGART